MSNGTKKYFYVYYSYELWGRGYIGKRECKCSPEEDIRYFGSFSDKSFNPTEKIILQTFDTVEEALQAEIILHEFYQVDKNPHFANRARQTSKKFYHNAPGKRPSEAAIEAARKRILSLSKDEYNELYKDRIEKTKTMFRGEGNPFYGKSHTEETKNLLSELSLGTIWWNNGKENKRCKECPGEGWVLGVYYENNPNIGRKMDKEHAARLRDMNCDYVYTFISPDGIVIETIFAKDVCDKFGLHTHSAVRVARGERKHHKGWKITRRPRTDKDK